MNFKRLISCHRFSVNVAISVLANGTLVTSVRVARQIDAAVVFARRNFAYHVSNRRAALQWAVEMGEVWISESATRSAA